MFVGTYDVLDFDQLRRELNEQVAQLERHYNEMVTGDPPLVSLICFQDPATGTWKHSAECIPEIFESNCDPVELQRLYYGLQCLDLLPILTLAFDNPSLARGQGLLNGLAFAYGGVYSSRC